MEELPSADQFIAFLNALPTTLSTRDWLLEFRSALRTLLPDVFDTMTISNRLDEDHREGCLNWANMTLAARDESVDGFSAESLPSELPVRIEVIIDQELARNGMDRSFFHPPTILSYCDKTWLGTLILFREASKPPFSPSLLALLDRLRPFFVFVFKDLSLRYHAEHPGDRFFYGAIERMTAQIGLTHQEMRVLLYRLLGHSYKEIASKLGISPSTVKNHLGTIHVKAGVTSQAALFARYLAPEFGLLMR